MNEIEIQACPLCGKQPTVQIGSRAPNGEWCELPMIRCRPCGLMNHAQSDLEAALKWNQRTCAGKLASEDNSKAKAGSLQPDGSALVSYIQRQEEWSAKTFGNGVRTKGITAHIRKELLEIEAAPHDVEEWIDVVILALDGAWRSGYSPEQIVAALEAKQAKNFKRTYPMPLSDDHPSEHLREAPNDKLCREAGQKDAR